MRRIRPEAATRQTPMSALPQRPTSSLRLLVIITFAAFATETLIMLVLPAPHGRFWLDAILDSALLVTFLLPMLYAFMVRPLQLEIASRLRSEAALREAQVHLERRVGERTLELTR